LIIIANNNNNIQYKVIRNRNNRIFREKGNKMAIAIAIAIDFDGL
jgi:hypothetical protein